VGCGWSGIDCGSHEGSGIAVSPVAVALLAAGQASWYAKDGRKCFQPATKKTGAGSHRSRPRQGCRLPAFQRRVRSNAGASLIDIGDGIGCIELHSLKNAIGGDVLAMISSVLKPDSDAVRDFAGFVIASDRENFSVGANLMQLLLAAQEGEWDELAGVIHNFQQMTAAHQVLPAPGGCRALWPHARGGAEICLHAARRQPMPRPTSAWWRRVSA